MAIVENMSDDEPVTLRQRGKSSHKSSIKKHINEKDLNIPLQYPSNISRPNSSPQLDVPPPGTIPAGAKIQTVSSTEEIERLSSSLQNGQNNEDEIFTTIIMAVPFTFLYLLLDILVHLQYSHRPSLSLLADHVMKALPSKSLGMIVWYTNRYPTHFLTTSVLMSSSILSGCRLIWLVNKASWSVVTAQAPAMGTLWILTIVQLPLSRAILTLAFVGGWIWYKGMKLAL
nr:hypothetical protein L204_01917 [Cryptococcus depauperatus CBS 7855]